jgi:hypothetical protein
MFSVLLEDPMEKDFTAICPECKNEIDLSSYPSISEGRSHKDANPLF